MLFHGIVIHWWNANCNVNSGLSHFERWMRVSLRAHFYILKCKNMHADASMSTAQNNLDLNYILRIVKVKQQCDSKVWFLLHDTYLISISVKVGSETNEKDSRLTKKVKKKTYLKNAINTKTWQIWLGIQMTKYTNAKKYWRPTVGAGSSSQCSETL